MKYFLMFCLLANGLAKAQTFPSFKPLKLPYETHMSDEVFQDALFQLKDVTLNERALLMEIDIEELRNSRLLEMYGFAPIGHIDMPNFNVFVIFSVQWNNDAPGDPLERSLGLIVLQKNTNAYLGGVNGAYWMQSDDYIDYEYDDEGEPIEPEEPVEQELDFMDCKIFFNPQKELIVETASWKVRLIPEGTFEEF